MRFGSGLRIGGDRGLRFEAHTQGGYGRGRWLTILYSGPSVGCMKKRLKMVSCLLFFAGVSGAWGQLAGTQRCAVFSPSGMLAKASLTKGSLRVSLYRSDGGVSNYETPVSEASAYAHECEIAFSPNEKSVAVVGRDQQIEVAAVSTDGAGTLHHFSVPWNAWKNSPQEQFNNTKLLVGLEDDESVILVRRVYGDGRKDQLLLERRNLEGEVLSEKALGTPFDRYEHNVSLVQSNAHPLVFFAGWCGANCFRSFDPVSGLADRGADLILPTTVASAPTALPAADQLLMVAGEERKEQKALLVDRTGAVKSELKLPLQKNPLSVVVPDWFQFRTPAVSSDGAVAVIAERRVAWVLIDTDRDWGSEFMLLDLAPLKVLSKVRTGKGGIGALAVDRRQGKVRVVGFWGNAWHDLEWDKEKDKWADRGPAKSA